MSKKTIIRAAIVSAMLVAVVMAIVPAVSADTSSSMSPTYYGEGVGAGVSGTHSGNSYYSCSWHAGRWQGSCQYIVGNLYFTLYANGSPMAGSTSGNTYDTSSYGPYTTLGASATSTFYDSRKGYFSWNSGYTQLP